MEPNKEILLYVLFIKVYTLEYLRSVRNSRIIRSLKFAF